MPRIAIVLVEPGIEALVEGVVQQMAVEPAFRSISHGLEVDFSLKTDPRWFHQPSDPRGIEAAVVEPLPHQHRFETHSVEDLPPGKDRQQ